MNVDGELIPPDLRERVALSMAEVGHALGLAASTVERMVASGELRSVKLGGRRLILAASVWHALGLDWSRNPSENEDPDLAAIADREIPPKVA